ncbi:hypothetical protein ACISU4_11975 [Streptomyces wuyuanensis]|uniref:hypothetical protein n=1 Tax=Streptomyces wuyuanensis TaxID=1196353 RepID=UPI0037F19DCD
MAYRADVVFLEDANPTLIDRNAAEFRRLHALIESTDDAFRAAIKVRWESEARDLYAKRLKESNSLADTLSEAPHSCISPRLVRRCRFDRRLDQAKEALG